MSNADATAFLDRIERDEVERTEEQLERTAGGAGGIPPGAVLAVAQRLAPLGEGWWPTKA